MADNTDSSRNAGHIPANTTPLPGPAVYDYAPPASTARTRQPSVSSAGMSSNDPPREPSSSMQASQTSAQSDSARRSRPRPLDYGEHRCPRANARAANADRTLSRHNPFIAVERPSQIDTASADPQKANSGEAYSLFRSTPRSRILSR